MHTLTWSVAGSVVGTLVAAFVLRFVLRRIVDRVVRTLSSRSMTERIARTRASRETGEADEVIAERTAARARTVGQLLKSVGSFLILGTAIVTVLGLVGFNVAPFVASAGVAGIAIGFGAQSLIKDFLTGTFMIFEDQYGVGDDIDTGQAAGTVERVGLRLTTLRDGDGVLWYIPNGTIQRVGNKSQGWALAKVDPIMAWDEWQKNSLARHAEVYPDIWYGIWSGPDTFNSIYDPINPGGTMLSDLIRKPGQIMDHVYATDFGMTDFPVMNMHPHSTPLFSLTKLLGVEFTPQGLILAPVLPMQSYRFTSPLLGLVKSKSSYSGWYAPSSGSGIWEIELRIPDSARFRRLEINGKTQSLQISSGKTVLMRGQGSQGAPLKWSLHI